MDALPRPEEYFANPDEYPRFAASQLSGMELFPYRAWALNRLCVYPDLVDAAERFLGSKNLESYKIELWAKYAGATSYDQRLHRDFGNHTLVVPRADGLHAQMTTFIQLFDVTEHDAPTRVVPPQYTRDLPFWPSLAPADLYEKEVAVTAPARGWPSNGKMSWPSSALSPHMSDALARMTPRQRDLFGWKLGSSNAYRLHPI